MPKRLLERTLEVYAMVHNESKTEAGRIIMDSKARFLIDTQVREVHRAYYNKLYEGLK